MSRGLFWGVVDSAADEVVGTVLNPRLLGGTLV